MVVSVARSQPNDPRLVILKCVGETPSKAICSECYTKFFTPQDLINNPRNAELHLRDQFALHKCKSHFADVA